MDTVKMRTCSHLLPDPGGEVVRELLDEVERRLKDADLHGTADLRCELGARPAQVQGSRQARRPSLRVSGSQG